MKIRGKRNKEWYLAKQNLKEEYEEKGIITCEARLSGCMRDFGLSFHHKRHRYCYYYGKTVEQRVRDLGDFDETILVCAYCHAKLFPDSKETYKIFEKLRKPK